MAKGEALVRAATRLDVDGVMVILRTKPQAKDISTALREAIENNLFSNEHEMQCAVVRALLEAGADPRQDHHILLSPLMTAVQANYDNPDIVRILVEAGATVNLTTLHRAAESRNSKIVDYLLTAGAPINEMDSMGNTLLHIACKNHDSISGFISAGADIRAANSSEVTPLHYAAMGTNYGNVDALLAAGADVNAKTWDGWTPLHLAANNDNFVNIRTLLDAGAIFDSRTSDGETAWDIAHRNRFSYVKMAIQDWQDHKPFRGLMDMMR